ncbi:hypothetical protein ACFY64_31500 [Streptomyces collinus]|uniref:hypothetical protein n=1 Tax=Streptomyces collinus TaxID=42684 RepID=UPI00367C8ED7
MNPNPWDWRALAGLAALAVVIGAGVAYCDNHGDDPVTTDPCVGAAYVLQAAPARATKNSSSKNGDRPPANVHKAPSPAVTKSTPKAARPATTATARPSAATTTPGHRHRPHGDIDLDLDGC